MKDVLDLLVECFGIEIDDVDDECVYISSYGVDVEVYNKELREKLLEVLGYEKDRND